MDNDPLVLAHARALLTNTTPQGVTTYVDADCHDPQRILAEARTVLDFTRPIAVMFMGVLGHVTEFDQARCIVARMLDALPSGSYLALWDGASTSTGIVEAETVYAQTGTVPYQVRSPDQIGRFFEGLDLVEPGLVSISQWRPTPTEVGTNQPVDGYGAVARKR